MTCSNFLFIYISNSTPHFVSSSSRRSPGNLKQWGFILYFPNRVRLHMTYKCLWKHTDMLLINKFNARVTIKNKSKRIVRDLKILKSLFVRAMQMKFWTHACRNHFPQRVYFRRKPKPSVMSVLKWRICIRRRLYSLRATDSVVNQANPTSPGHNGEGDLKLGLRRLAAKEPALKIIKHTHTHKFTINLQTVTKTDSYFRLSSLEIELGSQLLCVELPMFALLDRISFRLFKAYECQTLASNLLL